MKKRTKERLKKMTPKPIRPFLIKTYKALTLKRKIKLTKLQPYPSPTLSCFMAYDKFGIYCVPLSSLHRPLAQALLSKKVKEESTIQFLIKNFGSKDIVHAGAYCGDFLPALSTACSPNSKIWAFEPNQENYRCALITISVNGLTNIELIRAGIGAYNQPNATMINKSISGKFLGSGSTVIKNSNKLSHAQSLEVGVDRIDNIPAQCTESIRIVTIDDIIPENREISIIHLDIEGYEEEALKGALKTIYRYRPILVLEDFKINPWIAENILSIGYKVTNKLDRNTILSCT